MKYSSFLFTTMLLGYLIPVKAQPLKFKASKVDYDAFEQLVKEIKPHRQKHLVSLDSFIKMSKEKDVVILDTRSDKMFQRKHIKGAIHLDFTDFTQANLLKLIPNPKTKILIYCNNNFLGDEINFATKSFNPQLLKQEGKPITLALNIPTYINLYGYGYRHVFELSELVSMFDNRIEFEGTDVKK